MQKLRTSLSKAWKQLDKPTLTHGIASARVLLGVVVLFHCLSLFCDAHYFDTEGLGSYLSQTWKNRTPYFFPILGLETLASICFIIGWHTRCAGVLILLGLHFISPAIRLYEYGWHSACFSMIFLLLWAHPGRTFSIDARQIKKTNLYIEALPLRFFQVYVTAIYLAGASYRLFNTAWLKGEVVFTALVGSAFSRFPNVDIYALKPLLTIGNYFALYLEALAPVLLWISLTRTPTAICLMLIHTCLELSTTVGYWQFVMLAGLCTFLPNDWHRRVQRLISVP